MGFVVQSDTRIGGAWAPVVRYDTTHGYCHRDLHHPDGRVEQYPLPGMEFNAAFTWALRDIQTLWLLYRKAYHDEARE